jgi:IS6 family transposase
MCLCPRVATAPLPERPSFYALRVGPAPVEVTTDRAPLDPRIIEELVPAARHVTERYAKNVVEADADGSRRGSGRCADLKSTASARMIPAG